MHVHMHISANYTPFVYLQGLLLLNMKRDNYAKSKGCDLGFFYYSI